MKRWLNEVYRASAGERGAGIMEVVISLLMVALILPTVITTLETTVTTGWSDTVVAIWPFISVLALIGIAYYLYKQAAGASSR